MLIKAAGPEDTIIIYRQLVNYPRSMMVWFGTRDVNFYFHNFYNLITQMNKMDIILNFAILKYFKPYNDVFILVIF